MINNKIDVHAGKETVNIDTGEFDTFGDVICACKESKVRSKNTINNVHRVEGEKDAMINMDPLRKTTDKE